MKIYEYGNIDAPIVLIQPVDDHDMEGIENEVRTIRELTNADFGLVAVKVDSWNKDLSPWHAPAVFGNEDFGDGAEHTLDSMLELCAADKHYYLGGYSLAGLFALWAAFRTNRFAGIAAASPSIWFPGFTEYMSNHDCLSKTVYLSQGDKEEKTRNPIMATVGDSIRNGYDILMNKGIHCTLEWNKGNHFREPDIRTARAFAWVINEMDIKCPAACPL